MWSCVLCVRAQMHVHVAPVQPSLMKALKDVADKKDTKNWSYIDCQGPSRQATKCKCVAVPLMCLNLKPGPMAAVTECCCSTVSNSARNHTVSLRAEAAARGPHLSPPSQPAAASQL